MSEQNYFERKIPDWQFVYQTYARNYWSAVDRTMRLLNPFLLLDEIHTMRTIMRPPEKGGEGPREDD